MTAATATTRDAVTRAAWPLAVLALGFRVAQAMKTPGGDLGIFYTALHRFVTRAQPYHQHRVLYVFPPSSLPLLSPLGFLGRAGGQVLMTTASTAALVLAVVLVMRLLGHDWRSPAVAVGMLGLAFFYPAMWSLTLGQVDPLLLAGEAGFLVAAARGRWGWAGVALGLTIAIKPLLVVLLLVPLAYRQWRAVATAAAVVLGLTAVAAALGTDIVPYFTRVLPFQAAGSTVLIGAFNISLVGAAANLGIPPVLSWPARVLVLALTAVASWRRFREGPDDGLKLVELSGLLLLGSFLSFSFAEVHWAVLLLPLVLSVVAPGSLVRSAVAWVGIYLFASSDSWQTPNLGRLGTTMSSVRPAVGLLVLLLAVAVPLLRSAPGPRSAAG